MNLTYLTPYLPYIFLVAGLALTAIACFYVPKKPGLKETGIPVDGIVFEQWSTDPESSVNDKVIIRFVTRKQEWITAAMDQPSQVLYTGQFSNGETVSVYYNPDNPSEFYVDTKQSTFISRVVAGVAGIAIAIGALYKILM